MPYAGTPKALSTPLKVNVLFMSFFDLSCPLVWPVLTHETVHSLLKSAPLRKEDRLKLELKCDFWATVAIGPAYPLSFALSYAIIPSRVLESEERSDNHPFNEVRIRLCSRVLHEFLGYDKGFIEGFLEKKYGHLICPDDSELDEDSVKQMDAVLGGYGSDDVVDGILKWGFDWKRFKANKINGIGKNLAKGEPALGHTPRDVLNGISYAIVRKDNLSPYDPSFIDASLKSIEDSIEEIY